MNARTSSFDAPTSLDSLTPRELEVLGLLVQHMPNKQIARELDIAETTVDKHLKSVREKLGTRDRFETARVALSLQGWENPYPQFSSHDSAPCPAADALADLPRSSDFRFSDVLIPWHERRHDVPAPLGLEALDQRFGKSWRIVAIPFLALLLGMIAIWSLAFAKELTDLL